MLPMDELKTLSETSRDGVCQITRLALEGQEKMIGLNIDAAQEFIEKSSMQREQSWTEMAQVDPASVIPNLFTSTIKCGTAINTLFLGLATRLQKDLTAVVQERQHVLNATMLEEMGKYTSVIKKMTSAAVELEEHHGRKYRKLA